MTNYERFDKLHMVSYYVNGTGSSCNYSHHVNFLTREENLTFAKSSIEFSSIWSYLKVERKRQLNARSLEVSKNPLTQLLFLECSAFPISLNKRISDSRVLSVWRTLMARSLICLRRRAWHLLSKKLRDRSHNLLQRVNCRNICR